MSRGDSYVLGGVGLQPWYCLAAFAYLSHQGYHASVQNAGCGKHHDTTASHVDCHTTARNSYRDDGAGSDADF